MNVPDRRVFDCCGYRFDPQAFGCSLTFYPKVSELQPVEIPMLVSGRRALVEAIADAMSQTRVGLFADNIKFARLSLNDGGALTVESETYLIFVPVHMAFALLRDLEKMK